MAIRLYLRVFEQTSGHTKLIHKKFCLRWENFKKLYVLISIKRLVNIVIDGKYFLLG